MKYLLPALTMVIGLVIGAWVPQSELRVVKNELDAVKKDLSRVQKSSNSNQIVGNVTQLLGVQSSIQQQRRERPPKRPPAMTKSDTGETEVPADEELAGEATADEEASPEGTPQDFYEVIDMARDAWRLRSAQSRQALGEKLALDDRELLSFDHAIAEMNKKLEDELIDVTTIMLEKEVLTTEDGLLMVNRVSGVLLNTYSELDTVLPDKWRSQTGNEADLINYIDPVVAMPLGNLQDKNFREQLP